MNVLLFPIRMTTAPRTAVVLALTVAFLSAWGGWTRGARLAPSAQSRPAPVPAVGAGDAAGSSSVAAPAVALLPESGDANQAGSETTVSPVVTPADDAAEPDAIRAWARQDPSAAVRWLGGAAPGERRDAVLEIVCAEIATEDPAQAVALAETYSGGNRPLLENLVAAWAERDFASALAYARAQPPGELQSGLLARAALALAGRDPGAAATLVLADIAQPELRDEALIAIVHRWARHDAPAAAAWIEHWPAGDLRARALRELR